MYDYIHSFAGTSYSKLQNMTSFITQISNSLKFELVLEANSNSIKIEILKRLVPKLGKFVSKLKLNLMKLEFDVCSNLKF